MDSYETRSPQSIYAVTRMTLDAAHLATSPFDELYKILQCQICMDLMSSTFVLSCGHSYCYDCTYQWLRSHRNCPSCRKRITTKPVLAYSLKELRDILIRHQRQADRGSKAAALLERNAEEKEVYQKHASDPFPGMFREDDHNLGGRVFDGADNVWRCSRCHWEVEDLECR